MSTKKTTAVRIPKRVKTAMAKFDKEVKESNANYRKLGKKVPLDEKIMSCDPSVATVNLMITRQGIILSELNPLFPEPVVQTRKEPIPYQLAKEDESCYCFEHFFDHVDVN